MGFESSRVARRRLASLASTNELVQEALAPSAYPDLFSGEAASGPADLPRRYGPGGVRAASGSVSGGNRTTPTHPADLPSASAVPPALVEELDALAQDIVATPGAGGALLASYAAQQRALTMVLEAAKRAQGMPLPASVLMAAQMALATPTSLQGLSLL